MSAAWKQNNSMRSPYFDKLSNWGVFLYLSLSSFLIRLPFFFRDYVDRDESTFILMGQAWVDGYLPYTVLWDVKPPLTFLFYAVVIYLFGKSFIAIRLLGALLVALSAYFTYAIALKISTKRAALVSGFACVILQSMFGSIQGVMSEHILMVFYMAALYLLIRNLRNIALISAGLMFGIALMVKISIAFPILLIGLFLLVYFYRNFGFGGMVTKILYIAIPGISVVFLTFLPYYLSDIPQLWWDSVVLAPLAYTEAGRTAIIPLLGLCFPVVFFIIWAWKTKRLDLKKFEIALLIASIAGLLLSFLKGGRINSHYLIQLYPTLLVLVAITLSSELNKVKKKTIPWILGIILLLPMESYIEYWRIVQNKVQKGTFYNGEGFTVPQYLRNKNFETENILFLGYHIGYWVLDIYPPAKTATHPSNICKSEMFPYYNSERETAQEELRYIMEEVNPSIVITRTNRRVFDKVLKKENKYIDSILKTNYTLLERIDKADIYKLSE